MCEMVMMRDYVFTNVEWRRESARRRTIIVQNCLQQWDSPALEFAILSGRDHGALCVTAVTSEDERAELYTNDGGNILGWYNSRFPMYATALRGIVCMSPLSAVIARGMDPVQAFWFSGFQLSVPVLGKNRMPKCLSRALPIHLSTREVADLSHWFF